MWSLFIPNDLQWKISSIIRMIYLDEKLLLNPLSPHEIQNQSNQMKAMVMHCISLDIVWVLIHKAHAFLKYTMQQLELLQICPLITKIFFRIHSPFPVVSHFYKHLSTSLIAIGRHRTVRVNCLLRDKNRVTINRSRTRTTWSRVQPPM